MEDLLKGAYDLHIHTAPDVVQRKCGDLELARRLEGKPPVDFPQETAVGALARYISNESVTDFQPMNVNFGIIPPLGYRVKGKRNKNAELSKRALELLDGLDWR